MIASGRIAEPFWRRGGGVIFRHGYTYSGHAAVAAASHANLDILEREGLNARGLELEAELTDALEPLAAHPLVAEVRAPASWPPSSWPTRRSPIALPCSPVSTA